MAKLPHLPNFFLITCFIVYVAGSKILLATPVFLAQQNKKTLQGLCGCTHYHNRIILVANDT